MCSLGLFKLNIQTNNENNKNFLLYKVNSKKASFYGTRLISCFNLKEGHNYPRWKAWNEKKCKVQSTPFKISGWESKENDKLYVTSVTIILFEKNLRQTSSSFLFGRSMS